MEEVLKDGERGESKKEERRARAGEWKIFKQCFNRKREVAKLT